MAGSWSTRRRIIVATLIAGTLDILAAIGMTLSKGREIDAMLRYVGSGVWPDAAKLQATGASAGLAVHYGLMAIMAAVFVLAANLIPALKRQWLLWGLLYGLATYVAMNLVAVPLRFGTPLPHSAMQIVPQLLFHLFLVGVPIAWVARKG
ncbi:hypothetical protein [Sphingomonas sp. G-3-2-10]|uniref:hypothetical protein n=1 Tax=Sphingomonas sp. G-3-2-10 TaxID=2728838 RepID=UPI00146B575C|nr:hypothetical protein [Sphingomonas sp. G-3-2-10]NML06383.1 hypothetical protein [Sphingomonas sp. G-3-2-10]